MDASILVGSGIVLGDYPERDEAATGRIEELLTNLLGRVRLPFSSHRTQFEKFLAQVEEQASAVAALDERQTPDFVTNLRFALHP